MGYTPGSTLGGRRIDLGAIPLGGVDSAGVAWTVAPEDGFQGWDGPDVRASYSPREADHGAWAGPTYLAERVLTISGTIVAPDGATLDAATEQLRAAAALTDTLLTVYETTPKQCMVRRSGKVLIKQITDRLATYSVLLTAADPRRYSTTLQSQSTGLPSTSGGVTLPITLPLTITATTSSGTFTLSNVGTIGTRPRFTITGPVTAPQILVQMPDGTVNQLAYSDTLLSGDVLIVDTDAHTAVLNGVASRRRYLSGPWPEIPPGGTVSVQWIASSYDPSALLTGTCRSAWM